MRRSTPILLIDSEGLARDGLCALLRQEGLRLSGVYLSVHEALRADPHPTPQVTIIDFPLAMQPGPHALAHLKQRWPATGLLVLGAGRELSALKCAWQAGADGFLLRSDPRTELFCAIEALLHRRHYVSPALKRCVEPRQGPPRTAQPRALLSEREQQVVRLIAQGHRTREIAQLLGLSPKTVERHRTNIMRKLGVRSATEVVAYALTHRCVGF
ncbi:MAG TPA: response regulator transcription factor [Steroidobacteraceae bacterium]|nr:response regulator transcription factor [Steroidobacteraceae bacterium]